MTLRQQSNHGKITNLAPGKLLFANCIHATLLPRMHDNNSYINISFRDILGVVISGSCVGTYGPSNYIVSPNYPQEYDNHIDCRWLISSPGRKNLTLNFLDFETDWHDDSLNIFEGSNIHGNLLKTYSRHDSSPSPIVSSGSNVYLRFTSDFMFTSRGFKIEVSGKYKYYHKMIRIFLF